MAKSDPKKLASQRDYYARLVAAGWERVNVIVPADLADEIWQLVDQKRPRLPTARQRRRERSASPSAPAPSAVPVGPTSQSLGGSPRSAGQVR
jgi:hypothetical protein